MENVVTSGPQFLKFHSSDSIIHTIVAQSSETTLRFELSFRHRLDRERLLAAIDIVLIQEPILRCTLVGGDKPVWQRQDVKSNAILLHTESPEEYRRLKDQSIDIRHGPMLSLCLLQKCDGDTLLFKTAHEVTDGDGLKRIVSLVARHYSEPLAAIPSARELADRSRGLLQLVRELPWRRLPVLFWFNIKQKIDLSVPATSLNLSSAVVAHPGKGYASKTFDANTTDVLRNYARMRNASLNDLLMAAFFRALAKQSDWNGADALRITMSINLRQYLANPDQVSVSNFSSMECINLGTDLGVDFPETLKKVSAMTRLKKSQWIGLNILVDLLLQKILPFRWLKKMHRSMFKMIIKNNNTPFLLTNVGKIAAEDSVFDHAPESVELLAPVVYDPFWNTVAYEYNGQLKLSGFVFDAKTRLPLLKALYQGVDEELMAVVGHLVKANAAVEGSTRFEEVDTIA